MNVICLKTKRQFVKFLPLLPETDEYAYVDYAYGDYGDYNYNDYAYYEEEVEGDGESGKCLFSFDPFYAFLLYKSRAGHFR